MLSCIGRNVQYPCERYDMNSHDFLNYSPSDINWRINNYYQSTIDQQTHTLAQLIFRLDALALSVIATATWLGGWVAVCHSRYCIKTTIRIRKHFGPSGRPII